MRPAARRVLVAAGVVGALALVVLAVPPLREGAASVGRVLLEGDTGRLRDFLLGFGVWAPVVSAALMVSQAIVAPLPAFVITLTNGLLFGPLWGGLLSWSSAMVAAWLCFAIARWLGRPAAERFVGRTALDAADGFFQRYGLQAIVLARLLPFVPFDAISYAAGLTMMSTARFLLGTGLGQIPGTALYSWFGARATEASHILLVVFGASALLVVLRHLLARRRSPT